MSSRFRLFRPIEKGEFFVIFEDTAQGGIDKNFAQFMSKTRADIPLVMSMLGVAAQATPHLHQAAEWIYDQTGVPPVVGIERQNGGASEMHNLMQMNRNGKYELYRYVDPTTGKRTDKLGWDTNETSRAKMIGEWKIAYEREQVKLYDEETQKHHKTFITNKRGKPEAAPNTHDDGVMSCAGAYQLLLTENPTVRSTLTERSGEQSSFIY